MDTTRNSAEEDDEGAVAARMVSTWATKTVVRRLTTPDERGGDGQRDGVTDLRRLLHDGLRRRETSLGAGRDRPRRAAATTARRCR